MSATLPPREELRHGLPMSARPGVSPVVPGLGQVNVRAPPPPPRCRSCAFTASHLKPSDNRLSLCPFHGEPAAAARAQPLVGPDSRPSSPGRVRPLVGCPLMRLPRTEAVRVASEPGWSPCICAPHVARQEDSGSPCSQAQSDTWARGSSRRRSRTPWVGARGPPVVWAGCGARSDRQAGWAGLEDQPDAPPRPRHLLSCGPAPSGEAPGLASSPPGNVPTPGSLPKEGIGGGRAAPPGRTRTPGGGQRPRTRAWPGGSLAGALRERPGPGVGSSPGPARCDLSALAAAGDTRECAPL